MQKRAIKVDPEAFPAVFRSLLRQAEVFDSSCSDGARVLFLRLPKGEYYLKCAEKGSLKNEAEMTRYFHSKGLSAEVLAYESLAKDWMLTEAIPGEDCASKRYLAEPERLCDLLGEGLRALHDCDAAHCPVPARNDAYLAAAEEGYRAGRFDPSLLAVLPEDAALSEREEAWAFAYANRGALSGDSLLHGDFCLPNILLRDWRFSGYIDVGGGGVGDRHIDLFWGIWSLAYNLHTDRFSGRFLDAYGRRDVEPDKLRLIRAFELFG